ncbi:hypothetical protein [Fundidesulfovibrio putealis]|uniref:hypothetical protein n=1 Tax=Fundidesulfovibrio putealis TaxID=270496 RepID=UPI0012EB3D64|nr:hypothetical protein [Fundidesulfovibrio putealis]
MNPKHIAPPCNLFAYGNNQARRLAGRVEHQSESISLGVRGTRMPQGFPPESLLRFVERFLLRLVNVMYGQNPGHVSYMLAWNIGHEPAKEGA